MAAEDDISDTSVTSDEDDDDWLLGNLASGNTRLQNSAHDSIVLPFITSGWNTPAEEERDQ